MSVMLAALTLTNCTKDAAEDNVVVDNGKGFSFTANIDGVGTKATLDGVKTVWEAGDQVGFGGSVANMQTNNNVQLLAFDYTSGNTFTNATASYDEAQQFYAIYPFNANADGFLGIYPADAGNRANQATRFYNVGSKDGVATQNGASAAHIPANSPMYWMSEGAIAPAAVAVQFHHTASLMKFTVTNGEETDLTVKSLKLIVPSTIKICGTFYVDVTTGALTSSGDSYTFNNQTVNVENAPALAKGESFDVYMAVAPFELAADNMVTVIVTAADGTICTVEKKVAAAMSFEAGKINTATVNFVKDAVAEGPMTVTELAKAIEAGTTSFAGKTVKGIVSAVAAGDTDNFSKGTVILTDNSGNEYSAVKFYNNTDAGLAQFPELTIGDELEIDLTKAVIGDYNGKQITGITKDDVINGEVISIDNTIIAKEISIADYNANYAAYNNVYLKFVDVTPTVAGIFTGTIAFTDGTNSVNAYGKTSKYGNWEAGKIEIAKVKGTLYGVGQIYSNAAQLVPVTVADIEAFAAPFTIDKESLSFTADGGSDAVKIALKDGYTLGNIENTAAWLTVLPASDGTILFTAAANTEATPRNTHVNVAIMKGSAVAATITIEISQKAAGASSAMATYTLTFPDENSGSNGLTSNQYASTWIAKMDGFSWSITNFNNNNWGNNWAYIKCGRKNTASVGTITTDSAIEEAIEKVIVTIDKATVSNVNSTKLEVATDAAFTQNVQTITLPIATGAMTYNIPTPTENCYYRLTYDCAAGSANGLVQISKVVYTNE